MATGPAFCPDPDNKPLLDNTGRPILDGPFIDAVHYSGHRTRHSPSGTQTIWLNSTNNLGQHREDALASIPGRDCDLSAYDMVLTSPPGQQPQTFNLTQKWRNNGDGTDTSIIWQKDWQPYDFDSGWDLNLYCGNGRTHPAFPVGATWMFAFTYVTAQHIAYADDSTQRLIYPVIEIRDFWSGNLVTAGALHLWELCSHPPPPAPPSPCRYFCDMALVTGAVPYNEGNSVLIAWDSVPPPTTGDPERRTGHSVVHHSIGHSIFSGDFWAVDDNQQDIVRSGVNYALHGNGQIYTTGRHEAPLDQQPFSIYGSTSINPTPSKLSEIPYDRPPKKHVNGWTSDHCDKVYVADSASGPDHFTRYNPNSSAPPQRFHTLAASEAGGYVVRDTWGFGDPVAGQGCDGCEIGVVGGGAPSCCTGSIDITASVVLFPGGCAPNPFLWPHPSTPDCFILNVRVDLDPAGCPNDCLLDNSTDISICVCTGIGCFADPWCQMWNEDNLIFEIPVDNQDCDTHLFQIYFYWPYFESSCLTVSIVANSLLGCQESLVLQSQCAAA